MKRKDLIEFIGLFIFLALSAVSYFLQVNEDLKSKVLPAFVILGFVFTVKFLSITKENKEWRDF